MQLVKSLDQATNGSFLKPAISLPSSFIPEIMSMGRDNQEALLIADEVGASIIAVSLQNFFHGTRETNLLRKARQSGLHTYFGYPGEIILTTDVKDRLCDLFVENPNYFRTMIEQLKPDYLTTFDTYTYSNVPACISRIKILEATLSSYRLMDVPCKIVGLALGATPDQVYNHVEVLTKLGCKIIAHPVYEFRKESDTDSIRWRIWLSKKLEAKVLLLSCSPGLTARRRVYSDYYSSWSWFSSVSSRDGNAHRKRKAKLLRMISLAKKCSGQAHL